MLEEKKLSERYSVDSIEDNYAVLQNDDEVNQLVPLSLMPKGVKEGDILVKDNAGKLQKDEEATIKQRNKIKKLQDILFEKGEQNEL